MDFTFSSEEEAFRQEVRQFARQELPPGWLGMEDEYTPEVWPLTQAIARKMGQREWLALGWPVEYGGQGASLMKQLVFHEEAAYWGIPGLGMGIGGTAWVGPSLLLFGTEEQKRKHLPRIASGEEFWCTGYSEPGAGSDLASLTCRARTEGDGYIVEGQKVWTSAAHVAHWCWLAVRTDPQAPKHKGLSLLMVDMKSRGVTVRPIIDLAGRHSFNEVYFDGVRVPRGQRLGEENRGWYYVVVALDMERAWPGIRNTSQARRIADELLNYATGNEVAPALRHNLAELAVEVEAGRLLSYRNIWMLAQGMTPNYEASLVKVYGTELIERAAVLGMKLFGLAGQAGDSFLPQWVQHLYLVCLGNKIAAGTSEVQRNIIAQRGLGLPRD